MTRMPPVATHAVPGQDVGAQRNQPATQMPKARCAERPMVDLLRAAAGDPSRPLDMQVRRPLEQRLNHDLGHIRIHSGGASDAAAGRLGARAYALGRDIYLGAESRTLTGQRRERLLAHEAVHTVQQGGASVSPHEGLSISRPSDGAELEAARIADALPGLNMPMRRQPMIAGSSANAIARVAPQIQRDLTGPQKTFDGDFDLKLKTESHPNAKSGMSGTIKFKAGAKSPDSKSIRLLQIARLEDLGTGKDYKWTGDEANRMKVMTVANKATGAEEGYFVDVIHKNRTPRTAKADASVSPYYIDDYASLKSPNNKDGSKSGKTITEASLWDFPGWSSKSRFSFETAAKASDTGYIYATLKWGFTLGDPAKGTVASEHATASAFQSSTFNAAVIAFDEFYKNPGSSKAPK
jgi:hypothetical protein